MSLFISFEGGEGSGKTTQAEFLVQRFSASGIPCLHVREPGTTQLGLRIRDWLKRRLSGGGPISHRAELLLFAAARSELVAKVIGPALEANEKIVVSDRYADSSSAYQGYGRRLPLDEVDALNRLATNGVMPDLTLLLDCPPEEGMARVGSFQLKLPLERPSPSRAGKRDEEGTRFEEEPVEFHERVRRGYLKIAEQEPERWHVIDAARPVDDIAEEVWRVVSERMARAEIPPVPVQSRRNAV